MSTPILPAVEYPRIRHAGDGQWHTICPDCRELITALGIGGANSAWALHRTRRHGLSR